MMKDKKYKTRDRLKWLLLDELHDMQDVLKHLNLSEVNRAVFAKTQGVVNIRVTNNTSAPTCAELRKIYDEQRSI